MTIIDLKWNYRKHSSLYLKQMVNFIIRYLQLLSYWNKSTNYFISLSSLLIIINLIRMYHVRIHCLLKCSFRYLPESQPWWSSVVVVASALQVEQAVCTAHSPGETRPAWSPAVKAAAEEAGPINKWHIHFHCFLILKWGHNVLWT